MKTEDLEWTQTAGIWITAYMTTEPYRVYEIADLGNGFYCASKHLSAEGPAVDVVRRVQWSKILDFIKS